LSLKKLNIYFHLFKKISFLFGNITLKYLKIIKEINLIEQKFQNLG